MRQPKSHGLTLPEFAVALAALALVSAILHPIIVQARAKSNRAMAFHADTAFQIYASDVDGGHGAFEGKPLLVDGLNETLALYGIRRPAAPRKRSGKPATGCMPILRFGPSSYVADTGTLTYWEGRVGGAQSSCNIYPAVSGGSSLRLPDWDSVSTDENGHFWLVAGAMREGIGTVSVETETGASAEDSIYVQGS